MVHSVCTHTMNNESERHHDCLSNPTYPTRVTSSGAKSKSDYPCWYLLSFYRAYHAQDGETARKHNAPIFQGGIPLSTSALASESEQLRSEVPEKYRRISRPVPMMRPEYDVVVVGSGYGGAVAASRMARAGKSVCLLELGKERWPGEYHLSTIHPCPPPCPGWFSLFFGCFQDLILIVLIVASIISLVFGSIENPSSVRNATGCLIDAAARVFQFMLARSFQRL